MLVYFITVLQDYKKRLSVELSSSLFRGDPLNWNEPGTGAGVNSQQQTPQQSEDPYAMYHQQATPQPRQPGMHCCYKLLLIQARTIQLLIAFYMYNKWW